MIVLHAADLHLDSPFSGLPPHLARERRRERRELPDRLADLAAEREVQLVLLAGDLFDGEQVYPETVERLTAALGRMGCPVFIAPGNHDCWRPGGVYARTAWPENVHIFTRETVEAVELPELNAVVHGCAFTAPRRDTSPLADFHVPRDGRIHLMVTHGDAAAPDSPYGPITREEIAASGLDCLCLGHVHRQLVLDAGGTVCRYPGCPEGRGFDELGPCGVLVGQVEKVSQKWEFVPLCRRQYHILEVDVTGRESSAALEEALSAHSGEDIFRVILTGETGESGVDPETLAAPLRDRVYSLELRDRTRIAEKVWDRAEEDSLRGLFLTLLRQREQSAGSQEERDRVLLAARFGLAALDGRDL